MMMDEGNLVREGVEGEEQRMGSRRVRKEN